MSTYTIYGIDAEPWTAPKLSMGRRGGKLVPMSYKSMQLTAYQEAVREALLDAYPDVKPLEGPVRLRFLIHRHLGAYLNVEGNKVRRHHADATNMQKALEDAIQGVLIKNDRDVWDIQTTVFQGSEIDSFITIDVIEPGEPLP